MLIKKITFKNENKWTYENKTKIWPFESPLLNFGEHFQGWVSIHELLFHIRKICNHWNCNEIQYQNIIFKSSI